MAGITADSSVNCTIFPQLINSTFPGRVALWKDLDLWMQKDIYILTLSLLCSVVTQFSKQGTAAKYKIILVHTRNHWFVYLQSPNTAFVSGMAGSRGSN